MVGPTAHRNSDASSQERRGRGAPEPEDVDPSDQDDSDQDDSDQVGAESPEHLDRPLSEPVRQRVVALASDALGALTSEEVPASLRPFRGFQPAKRARLAATPLAAAVEHDRAFRGQVRARAREGLPDLVAALESGRPPAAADPLDVAAVAYLVRSAGWTGLVAAAEEDLRQGADRQASLGAQEATARLEEQLAAARAQGRAEVERVRADLTAAKAEVSDLRRRLHEARQGRREAAEQARVALEELDQVRAGAAADVAAAEAELRRVRGRLAEVEAALDTARRTAREGRALEDTRVRLLLDVLLEAGAGLRRELALPPAGPGSVRPADVVPAVLPETAGVGHVVGKAQEPDDPALLDQLLTLPQVHLVVDGYNVTKLGYGSLPLQVQRERLVAGLAVLAGRTGAEVTCCFDGAELAQPVIMATPRGVRVLFSRPGEIADELIRRLVANEPSGRPVVVVSSDKEVAEGVSRSGARPVASATLLRRLERG
ncbi:MAG: NYN domain-containing protein [Motilibacteraceae bacterium]